MDSKCRLPVWVNLFILSPVRGHIYEDHLGGQISLLGPLVCFAIFIAICACFCRECRRREAMLASGTTVAMPPDPFQLSPHRPGAMLYEPAVAGAHPQHLPSQPMAPPPGFMSYPYNTMPHDPPPPYEYK
uniref:Putative secreted protein n=1 Tax=Ixodes ricinus TaxID=34613 RepID=A0A131Y8C1_IXORI